VAFRLKPEMSLRKNLRRLIRKQIEGAIEDMGGSGAKSRDEVVHEARKTMKRVRAVLRLARSPIGGAKYRKANTELRDAARPLTEVRDAKILIETIDKLADQVKERVAGQAFEGVRQMLTSHAHSVRKGVLNREHAFSKIRKTLKGLQSDIGDWSDVPNKWSSIGDGIADTYRKAADAFGDAAADPTPEKLHEWRKQAKYLRYQLQLLQPLWPERMEELENEADKMGELLGDDHDLTLLRQMLITNKDTSNDGDIDLLLALIEHRQKQLRDEAMMLGNRFFQDSSSDFTRRLKGYWRTWCEGTNKVDIAVSVA
jgi:CHAD domain-containing protein